MSKRHLSDQQHRRIAAAHEQVIADGESHQGLVVTSFGKRVEVEYGDRQRLDCHVKTTLGQVVVGDRVHWQYEQNQRTGVIVGIEPRRHLLSRPDHYKQTKAIAANVDQIIIVTTAVPAPILYFIDKYLVIAQLQGITPVIVINKMDLQSPDDVTAVDEVMRLYRGLNYHVITASAINSSGLAPLVACCQGHANIIVGQSGVGKSALINALLGNAIAEVGDVSIANGQKGRHTTTTTRLYHLPEGGELIDSPGIREFGLWNMDTAEVVKGFREFLPYAGHCQFRNCRHHAEKGCALEVALHTGSIAASRLLSYRRIVQEIVNT